MTVSGDNCSHLHLHPYSHESVTVTETLFHPNNESISLLYIYSDLLWDLPIRIYSSTLLNVFTNVSNFPCRQTIKCIFKLASTATRHSCPIKFQLNIHLYHYVTEFLIFHPILHIACYPQTSLICFRYPIMIINLRRKPKCTSFLFPILTN